MTQNQIKNLAVGLFMISMIGYALIINFTLIGLIGGVVASGLILLFALAYNKQQSVVEKIDLLILFLVLGILSTHLQRLIDTFSTSLFTDGFSKNLTLQIMALFIGPLIGYLFYSLAKKTIITATKTICKYLGLFFTIWGFLIFFFGALNAPALPQLILMFSLYGVIEFCRSNRTQEKKVLRRPAYIAFCFSILLLLLLVFFPSFTLSGMNINAFLSITVFPWYSVLLITLFLTSITGIGFYYSKNLIDEDSIFLAGVIGLVWVIKASVYYWFSFHWIAICIYALVVFGLMNRFIKYNKENKKFLDSSIRDNEFYWIIILAVSVVVSIFLIYHGYVFFWLSVIISILVILFFNKNFTGWVKNAVYWSSLLFCISCSACIFSLQNGFSVEKIKIIVAIFLLSSAVMWMLNHKNHIGQNKFTVVKPVIVIIFALIVIIPAFKAGSNIKVAFSDSSVNVGALVKEKTDITINITADGKNNQVRKISYVWLDSFLIDNAAPVNLKPDGKEITLSIEKNHLVLWTEDMYGVVTRQDKWYYGTSFDSGKIQ